MMNMDRQHEQDERLLQAKLTRAMIRCGFADAPNTGRQIPEDHSVYPVHPPN